MVVLYCDPPPEKKAEMYFMSIACMIFIASYWETTDRDFRPLNRLPQPAAHPLATALNARLAYRIKNLTAAMLDL